VRRHPDDIADDELTRAVRRHWGLVAEAAEYVAVGGGSHHWRTPNLWLTVDDLDRKPFLGRTRSATLEGLRAALHVAADLRESGLDFVVAPTLTPDGEILVLLAEHYALAVYPLLSGSTYPFGSALPTAERDELLQLLMRLHSTAPPEGARPVTVAIALREAITDALSSLGEEWTSGPLAERARQNMAAHQDNVQHLLMEFDRLAARVRARAAPLVVSHGEPHPANLMCVDTRLLLLDWDTVGLAPPERDLWWLADMPDLPARYAAATGSAIDREALALYRLRWQLDDVAYALQLLRAAHDDSVEAQLCSTTLARSVEVAAWMR
jgi:spectinomycin phosphotransferase